jgi:hypothetical protein
MAEPRLQRPITRPLLEALLELARSADRNDAAKDPARPRHAKLRVVSDRRQAA